MENHYKNLNYKTQLCVKIKIYNDVFRRTKIRESDKKLYR